MTSLLLKYNFYSFLFLFFSYFYIAKGDHSFSFEKVVVKGRGCPTGSTSVVKGVGQKVVSILFDHFHVEVPQNNGNNDNGEGNKFNQRLDRKICHIIVKTRLPVDEKVDYIEIALDYRGSSIVQKGAMAYFKSVFVKAKGLEKTRRERTLILRKRWNNRGLLKDKVEHDWHLKGRKKIFIKSKCSTAQNNRILFSVNNVLAAKIKTKSIEDDTYALVHLDSTDVSGNMTLSIHTSLCQ